MPIAFIDTEIDVRTRKILDIGALKDDGAMFRGASVVGLADFLGQTRWLCGHNLLYHDLQYIREPLRTAGLTNFKFIDTLYLSPLLFPKKPYHKLVKDDKLQSDELNNPLNDSIKARDLFHDEVAAFARLNPAVKEIFYSLLRHQPEFEGFFDYLSFAVNVRDLQLLIREYFGWMICERADLSRMIYSQPVALAYCLALIDSYRDDAVHSITPAWVLKNYPEVDRILYLLRSKPCFEGCSYCHQAFDIYRGLQRFFGYSTFRTYNNEPLQEKAVQAAIDNKSLLAVFPTGGGKSVTFQLPALMSGEHARALTVVISPLQSLMKDQVDNLEKIGITDAVTINGLLDPIDRAKSYERVEDGSASLLYLSPEALRSKTVERLILGRKIARFVIDEAHCFSSWGHDFRVDYLYIGEFIKMIREKKNLDVIPVSCFTATARPLVIEDIQDYFKKELNIDLELFTSSASRTNLHYQVVSKESEEEKYQATRDLIEEKNCPTIVYVSRTARAYKLAERLNSDGFLSRPYHGKMESQEKIQNQNAFLDGTVPVMVATSAFGMGVDKKDVGMVIHYDISDSLENYVQEAGRAGRDEHIQAECYVLYSEEDLNKHFALLNQTKLSIKEIQQVWRAVKSLTRLRTKASNSALEIARRAGWDESVREIETRVTTAIAALEDAGYLKRGQNSPRIFASSILLNTAQEATDRINQSERFNPAQKEAAIRIIKKLFSGKSRRKNSDDDGDTRVDYISDHLGIVREEVIRIIALLKEEKILADNKDLSAFIKRGDQKNRSMAILESFVKIENFLLGKIDSDEKIVHLKELNQEAEMEGYGEANTNRIKSVLNFWAIKNWIRKQNLSHSHHHLGIQAIQPIETLKDRSAKRHELARFIVDYLFTKSQTSGPADIFTSEEILIEFSVHELKEAFENQLALFNNSATIDDVEDALFFLSRIEAIKIEGGFLVVYNRLSLERLELNPRINYKTEDYQKLNDFYNTKIQQIHIVGEYAKKMIEDYKGALQFVDDYFHLNYQSFLKKYFKGDRQKEIRQNLTPAKFKQIFGELSIPQFNIIDDRDNNRIVVVAGPGSGKTRVLVHKLAALYLLEDVKHEQILMLTFSRAAATEFKQRLLKLIGNAAHFIEIKTFHSYCFDLLGQVGSLEKSDDIIAKTVARIESGDVDLSRITKSVLVLDEAQDMTEKEFMLVKALMEKNDDLRVIAVGDDDQNIYEFRGSDSKYFLELAKGDHSETYPLLQNYRSKANIVAVSNRLAEKLKNRFKKNPVDAVQREPGEVKVIRYSKPHLILPLVESILKTDLKGSTAVLTRTNDEALLIVGLLKRNGYPAKLIQSTESCKVHHLAEIKYFLSCLGSDRSIAVVADEIWSDAVRALKMVYQRSEMLELCLTLIQQFESINAGRRKYRTDIESYIRETKFEELYTIDGSCIFVTTIHKAKGKEFDNVFLLLDQFDYTSQAAMRQLYVGFTRAKNLLAVHHNSDHLNFLGEDFAQHQTDDRDHAQPDEIVLQLTYEDVYLDFFIHRQHLLQNVMSGDRLLVRDNQCTTIDHTTILRFSKKFMQTLEEKAAKGFQIIAANVHLVVHWQKEGTEEEYKIVLPEVCLKNKGDADVGSQRSAISD